MPNSIELESAPVGFYQRGRATVRDRFVENISNPLNDRLNKAMRDFEEKEQARIKKAGKKPQSTSGGQSDPILNLERPYRSRRKLPSSRGSSRGTSAFRSTTIDDSTDHEDDIVQDRANLQSNSSLAIPSEVSDIPSAIRDEEAGHQVVSDENIYLERKREALDDASKALQKFQRRALAALGDDFRRALRAFRYSAQFLVVKRGGIPAAEDLNNIKRMVEAFSELLERYCTSLKWENEVESISQNDPRNIKELIDEWNACLNSLDFEGNDDALETASSLAQECHDIYRGRKIHSRGVKDQVGAAKDAIKLFLKELEKSGDEITDFYKEDLGVIFDLLIAMKKTLAGLSTDREIAPEDSASSVGARPKTARPITRESGSSAQTGGLDSIFSNPSQRDSCTSADEPLGNTNIPAQSENYIRNISDVNSTVARATRSETDNELTAAQENIKAERSSKHRRRDSDSSGNAVKRKRRKVPNISELSEEERHVLLDILNKFKEKVQGWDRKMDIRMTAFTIKLKNMGAFSTLAILKAVLKRLEKIPSVSITAIKSMLKTNPLAVLKDLLPGFFMGNSSRSSLGSATSTISFQRQRPEPSRKVRSSREKNRSLSLSREAFYSLHAAEKVASDVTVTPKQEQSILEVATEAPSNTDKDSARHIEEKQNVQLQKAESNLEAALEQSPQAEVAEQSAPAEKAPACEDTAVILEGDKPKPKKRAQINDHVEIAGGRAGFNASVFEELRARTDRRTTPQAGSIVSSAARTFDDDNEFWEDVDNTTDVSRDTAKERSSDYTSRAVRHGSSHTSQVSGSPFSDRHATSEMSANALKKPHYPKESFATQGAQEKLKNASQHSTEEQRQDDVHRSRSNTSAKRQKLPLQPPAPELAEADRINPTHSGRMHQRKVGETVSSGRHNHDKRDSRGVPDSDIISTKGKQTRHDGRLGSDVSNRHSVWRESGHDNTESVGQLTRIRTYEPVFFGLFSRLAREELVGSNEKMVRRFDRNKRSLRRVATSSLGSR